MKVVQKTDIWVGLFIIVTVGIVVTALVATSGWGVRRFDLFIKANDVQNVAIDTRIYMQGLEIGRVAAIEPRPSSKDGQLEFVIRASMLAELAGGDTLELPCAVDVEVEEGLLGGATLKLHVDAEEAAREGRCVTQAMLNPARDTIEMHHKASVSEAFASLATDLKSTLADAISSATGTVNAYRRLADSLSRTTGSARAFMEGIRPGTEQTLSEVATNMARLRRLLDTADVRTGNTFRQLDLTMEQSRTTMDQSSRLMASADSLTKLLTSMGAENRPELRDMLQDARFLTQQLMYVMEQLSRRPMRAMSGVQLPESLTAEGRARRLRADSSARADSIRQLPRDSARTRP